MESKQASWRRLSWSLVYLVGDLAFRTIALVILVRLTSKAQMGVLTFWATLAAFAAVAMSVGGASFAAIEMARAPTKAGAVFIRLATLRSRIWAPAVACLFAYGIWSEQSLALPFLFASILLVGGAGALGAGSYGVLSVNGALDGLGKVRLDLLFRCVGSFFCLLFLGVVFVFPALCSYEWLPVAALLGGIINLVLGVVYLKPKLASTRRASLDRSHLRFAIPLWTFAILGLVQTRVDLLFLKNYLTESELGTYGVAGYLAAVMILPAGVLGRVFAPKLAAPAQTEHERLMRITPRFCMLLIGLVLAGILCFLGLADLLLWPLGAKYEAAAPFLRILSLEVCTTALFFMPAIWLAVNNKRFFFMLGLAVAAASSVLLNYLLIPQYGATGAAWAHVSSLALGQLVYLVGFVLCVAKIRNERRSSLQASDGVLPQDSMPIAGDSVEVEELVQSCKENVDGCI